MPPTEETRTITPGVIRRYLGALRLSEEPSTTEGERTNARATVATMTARYPGIAAHACPPATSPRSRPSAPAPNVYTEFFDRYGQGGVRSTPATGNPPGFGPIPGFGSVDAPPQAPPADPFAFVEQQRRQRQQQEQADAAKAARKRDAADARVVEQQRARRAREEQEAILAEQRAQDRAQQQAAETAERDARLRAQQVAEERRRAEAAEATAVLARLAYCMETDEPFPFAEHVRHVPSVNVATIADVWDRLRNLNGGALPAPDILLHHFETLPPERTWPWIGIIMDAETVLAANRDRRAVASQIGRIVRHATAGVCFFRVDG